MQNLQRLLLFCMIGGVALLAGSGPVRSQAQQLLGDANHDGNISLTDFQVWRTAYMQASPQPTPPPPTGDPTAAPTMAPDRCGDADYPTATCTGVRADTTLVTHAGTLTITTPNTVIENRHIKGNVDIRASGVIIRNSQIDGYVANDNGAGTNSFTIEDSTIGTNTCSSWGNGAIGISNYTARRVKIINFSDGFRIAGSNITIVDSYVSLCAPNCDAHSDGIQAYGASGGTNITINHNAIDQTKVPSCAQTAPIFIPNDGANQGNQNITVNITNNVLAGGGYSLRVFGSLPFSAPNITGNKIVKDSYGYGPVDITCSKVGEWANNSLVTYNWATGTVINEVETLATCQ